MMMQVVYLSEYRVHFWIIPSYYKVEGIAVFKAVIAVDGGCDVAYRSIVLVVVHDDG